MKLMRQAADGEDASIKHVAMENRLYPMRELLGELLLESGRPRRCDTDAAKSFYARVIELSKQAEGNRPELQRAHGFGSK